jgi:hypothetical protein
MAPSFSATSTIEATVTTITTVTSVMVVTIVMLLAHLTRSPSSKRRSPACRKMSVRSSNRR